MSFSRKWAALTLALASFVPLAGAAPAEAMVITDVNLATKTITITGDAADNLIVFDKTAPTMGNIIARGEDTGLATDGTATIIVEGAGGVDTIDLSALAAADYLAQPTLAGGEGNDLITGGKGNDFLDGEAGNDQLVGSPGNDIVVGGPQNDTMTWKPGDGSDQNIGEEGEDEVVVVGGNAATETFSYKADPDNDGLFIFARIESNPFKINGEAELLTLDGKAGADFAGPGAATGLKDVTELTLIGGEGNDELTGGDGNDRIFGDDGLDVLKGFTGDDEVFGGTQADTMVWNPGDGTDTNDGGADFDETFVFGGANPETFSYQPGAAGHVTFARTDPKPFAVDMVATERLSVDGGGGNDTMAPGSATGLAAIELALSGGDGDDNLTGGDGDDVLLGDAGNDRLVGFKGTDIVLGGENDDEMVWNNGDQTDFNTGEGGVDKVVVNGSSTAADAFAFKPAEADGRFEIARTNFGQFTVNGEAEQLIANGQGGPDRMRPEGDGGLANRTSITLNGGEGDDDLAGGDGGDAINGEAGDDTLLGGDGGDTIAAGAGRDLADGQNGDDRITARDGQKDLVRGGSGVDSAQTDAVDAVDLVFGIEALDAIVLPKEPAADTKAELPQVGKIAVAGKGRKLSAKVPISCPAAEAGGCQTTLTVQTAGPVKVGDVRAIVVLGSTTANLPAGAKTTASIRLIPGAAGLAKNRRLPIRIGIKTTDAAGNEAGEVVKTTLRVPEI